MRKAKRERAPARVKPPNAKARKRLAFWPGALAIALGVPALFWLRFGTVNGYAFACTGFLLLLVFGIEFIPQLNQKYGQELSGLEIEPRWYDRLGVVWLLAIPFAPLIGWAEQSYVELAPGNYRWVLGARAFVCVVVPLVTVLPLLRYVRGRASAYALLILFLGTAFPISTGYAAAVDFVTGASWQTIDIVQLERVTLVRQHGPRLKSTLVATLADGRVLEASASVVTPHSGSSRALVLERTGQILAVQ